MNFGDFVDSISYSSSSNSTAPPAGSMPTGGMSQPRLVFQPLSTALHVPGLSLALDADFSARAGDEYEISNAGGRNIRDEENESRSASENMDGVSGDDRDGISDKSRRKKRYHRHTPQQIQELEAVFKECPHPDEKQRLELSKKLSLDTRQVKFWFQNRRTQMKTQIERHQNSLLRQENDELRAENMSIREAIANPICTNCGGAAIIGEMSMEEQHLRIQNTRLRSELERVCSLAGKILNRSPANSSLELSGVASTLPLIPSELGLLSQLVTKKAAMNMVPIDRSVEKTVYLELALAAMDEFMKLAQIDEPLWTKSLENGRQVLCHEQYLRSFTPCIGMKHDSFVYEASKETVSVIISGSALVESLMDSDKWRDVFPGIVSRNTTTEVICNGAGGTRNGVLLLMNATFQVLSPLVPVREVNFLRFCKQHGEGTWAIVDVSVDTIQESRGGPLLPNSRRLPSGCLIQEMPNSYSKVTWVEHSEYDETVIHHLYRRVIAASIGFGAPRWAGTLRRQSESLTMSSATPPTDHTAITAGGRKSMLKLAERMSNSFCDGICASSSPKWSKLKMENVDSNIQVMTRKSVEDPGVPPGIVLSAASSVWVPVAPQRLFDFLRNERLRSEWDILSNGSPVQEMARIAKGQHQGNCVSLLRVTAGTPNSNQSSMLILQETRIDPAEFLVVYAPVDIPAMHVVMNGGDSAYVALLPSGFAILPDAGTEKPNGSLLTIGFQILINSQPTATLTVESVQTVSNLISCTVQKIKSALRSEN